MQLTAKTWKNISDSVDVGEVVKHGVKDVRTIPEPEFGYFDTPGKKELPLMYPEHDENNQEMRMVKSKKRLYMKTYRSENI